MSTTRRLKKLQLKKKLSDAEFRELVKLSPKGSFKQAPFLTQHLGIKEINLLKAFRNLKMINQRSIYAYKHKCYIEVLSLRMLIFDHLLRMYICSEVAKRAKPYGIVLKPNMQFNKILNMCKKLSIDKKLVDKISRFVKLRNKAVHRLLLGEIEYKYLKRVCDRYKNLVKEAVDYLLPRIFYIPMN